jgi:hypothetical protein
MTAQPSESFELAMWMDGTESEAQRNACVNDMFTAFYRMAELSGVKIKQPVFVIKAPGDERVPPVPDHIAGPNVRLLVGEALITGLVWQSPAGSFVTDQLDAVDRARLRKITRRARRAHNPGAKRLSDAETDAIINRVGPESAAKALRAAVNSGLVH